MDATNDNDLVREYANTASESAFEGLVRAHVDFVFGTALRQLGSHTLAEEVTQNVFLALARKSSSLVNHKTVTGWLYQTTLFECRYRLRTELRREKRELAAQEWERLQTDSESIWQPLLPLLDDALLDLKEPDRVAVILRFMEQKSLRDVGASLGVSEDTARKRVDKALDCLTRFFRLHGFAIPAVTAAVPLFSLAAHAAPAGLASTATAAALSGAAEAVSALTLINKTLFLMATTKMKVIAGAAIVALLLISTSTVLIRHHREQINSEVQTPLEQQRAEDLRRMQEVRSAVVRMLTFASSNDGQLPRKAEDLGEDPKATAWEIVAPADFALKGDSEEIRNVNASTVIVQEKNPDKKGRRVKGYADGHSQF